MKYSTICLILMPLFMAKGCGQIDGDDLPADRSINASLSNNSSDTLDVGVGKKADRLELFLAVIGERSSISSLEPLLVRVRLINCTTETLSVWSSDPGEDFRLKVTDAAGKIVSITRYEESLEKKRNSLIDHGKGVISLKPNEELTGVLQVDRSYDMSTSGDYLISASREIPSPEYPGRLGLERPGIMAESNKVKVSIVEPPTWAGSIDLTHVTGQSD